MGQRTVRRSSFVAQYIYIYLYRDVLVRGARMHGYTRQDPAAVQNDLVMANNMPQSARRPSSDSSP
ncbi:hypothetical protein VFPFJ_05077 [Purpureocillium lilacinum]|uniref:Uncharacterized protein n=1 Tax=Purpureocillium lilacinum TaxID=33203 RepID=A0A179HMM4_PURLI|nr:hypothetical protein VFPFJ_05077 [Purpureocillium lilacinum]OAQ90918.1 hypothetical protein VFPFJ_05077 [Purpureocillium lilacinum]